MVLNGLETVKAAKGDPRMGKNGFSESPSLSTQIRKIPFQVSMDNVVLINYALGMLTRALEKGFYSTVDPTHPYYAVNYLVSALQQYAGGGVPALQQLPKVILSIGQAIAPKEVGLGNGRASYANVLQSVPSGDSVSTENDIGYTPYGYTYVIGPSTGTSVNGFPSIDTSTPSAAPPTVAQTAFQEMFQLLSNVVGETNDFQSVPIATVSRLKKDVSTYAQPTDIVGLGAAGSGSAGFAAISQLEVPIFRPYLAAMNSFVSVEEPPQNRFGGLNVTTAGDSLWLGGSMGTLVKSKHWEMQRYPKFHAVDFLEFADVLAQWVSNIQTAYLGDPTGVQNNQPATSIVCPLTIQEMQLLLRNVCMTAFKSTQAAVQGLYPFVPDSSSDNQFVPYTAHAGTCFIDSIDMQLPLPLVENLRDLVYRKVKRSKTDVEFFVPVLGQYALDELDTGDYNYHGSVNGGTPGSFPSFTVTSQFVKKVKSPKTGLIVEEVLPETVISLVDGGYTSGYVAINNPAQLKFLATQWNNWLKDHNLAMYSVPLCQLGTEQGINVLFSGNMTRYWAQPPARIRKEQENPEGVYDSRRFRPRNKVMLTSPYANRLVVADSAQSEIIGTAYEQVQSTWILPIVEVEFASGPLVNSTVLPRWQAIMKEPFVQTYSSGDDGVTLATMHATYASKMVKARQGEPDDLTQLLVEAATQGRGGILSGLVGGALSALFPKAASTISAVADMVPI